MANNGAHLNGSVTAIVFARSFDSAADALEDCVVDRRDVWGASTVRSFGARCEELGESMFSVVRDQAPVKVTLLGPVGVDNARGSTGPKPTTLLALLAVHVGTVVPTDQIVDTLWQDQRPNNVRAAIHTNISVLRRVSGQNALLRRAGGYLLSPEHLTVDLDRVRQLVTNGRALARRGAHHEAVSILREALASWRTDHVLGGAVGDWADSERARLVDYRITLYEDLLESALAVGVEGVAADDLMALVDRHPLRESLRGQLIRTLALVGRHADALTCYQEGRRVLADELGVEPGPELQTIQQQLLSRGTVPGPTPVAATTRIVPRQLPPDAADFTGRSGELNRLSRCSAPIVALFGKPGVGKSALAIHIGHLLCDRFTDGELFADLRGTRDSPSLPFDVLRQFLRALGVAEAAVPASEDECVALYRSLLADRAVLVVLDDAADIAQVRRLLPTGPNSLCVTTSRARLSTLAGAEHLDVQTLTGPDAVDLLAGLIGEDRVGREPDQATDITRLCGRLPLAIRLAGARLAARPDWPLARLADRLRQQHHVLNELAVGDLEVRGSLSLSYRALTPQQQVALRRVAWLGTPDFSVWLVAVLTGSSTREAERVAEQLVDAQLADTSTSSSGSRYRLHDLTRVFGWERAQEEEQHTDLATAVARVAECCAGLVDRVSAGSPMRLLRSLLPDAFPFDVSDFATGLEKSAPLEWLEAEQDVLVHVVVRASELGLVGEAARLAAVLCSSSFANSHAFPHWWRTHSAVLEAARRVDDIGSRALVLTGLGWLRRQQDRLDEAADYFEQARAAFEKIGDRRGVPVTELKLGGTLRELGRLDAADRVRSRTIVEFERCGSREATEMVGDRLGRAIYDGDLLLGS